MKRTLLSAIGLATALAFAAPVMGTTVANAATKTVTCSTKTDKDCKADKKAETHKKATKKTAHKVTAKKHKVAHKTIKKHKKVAHKATPAKKDTKKSS
jgi:hypothetical protein